MFWVNGWAGKASWPGLCALTQRHPTPRTFWNLHARRFSVPKDWPLVVGLRPKVGHWSLGCTQSLGAGPGEYIQNSGKILATSKRPHI